MNYHIEKEYKMMLNNSQYEALLKTLNSPVYKQINYYYSSNSKTTAFRIREINNQFFFTLKVKDSTNSHKEYEFEIDSNSLEDQRIKELFKEYNINDYKYVGDLITYRCDKKLEKGIISLDKNEYLGITDYEIEYELYNSTDGDNKDLIKLLNDNGIEYKENTVTKRKRFAIALKEE